MQLSGQKIFDQCLRNTLHADTQVEALQVSLTAGSIYRIKSSGDLDFGGSELQLPDREILEPEKRDEEDDYGWWDLAAEQYLMKLNEVLQLPEGAVARLSPHDHLNWTGATHPTLELDSEDNDAQLLVPLDAPDSGISIKQNARVTSLRVFRFGA